jgi:hypothetical protein
VERVPFSERLWCSVDEARQVAGEGRTKFYEKITAGEIVSKKEGRRRLIYVPSLQQTIGPRGTAMSALLSTTPDETRFSPKDSDGETQEVRVIMVGRSACENIVAVMRQMGLNPTINRK